MYDVYTVASNFVISKFLLNCVSMVCAHAQIACMDKRLNKMMSASDDPRRLLVTVILQQCSNQPVTVSIIHTSNMQWLSSSSI